MTNNSECYIKIPIDCSNNAPNIGENGNWYIGDTDTGIKAQGKDGEPGAKGDKGDPGVPGAPGAQGQAGSFANMDVLFEGNAKTAGSTYNLLKPITDYKILAIEYGTPITETIDYSASFEWVVNPRISSRSRCYRGIRMISDEGIGMVRFVIYWNFPTANTFTVGEIFSTGQPGKLAILKIYGIK